MRDEELPSFSEMRESAKANWNEEHPNDEECFVDAFLNGEYHEEAVDFAAFATGLSRNQLASLFLPVGHILIAGAAQHRDGPTLKTLMNCFAALGKWQRGHLHKPEEILVPLSEVRQLLFDEVLANCTTWWIQSFYQFHILEAGIHQRMGLRVFDLTSKYELLESEIDKLVS